MEGTEGQKEEGRRRRKALPMPYAHQLPKFAKDGTVLGVCNEMKHYSYRVLANLSFFGDRPIWTRDFA